MERITVQKFCFVRSENDYPCETKCLAWMGSQPLAVVADNIVSAALEVVVINILTDGLEERTVLVWVAWVTLY